MNRREFIQTTTLLAGTTLVEAARGETDKLRTAVIGAGGRGVELMEEGIWANDSLQIVALADVYEPHQKGGALSAWLANAQVVLEGRKPTPDQMAKLKAATKPTPYYDYQEMLATEKLDAVIIATPPQTHHAILLACLDAGLHVFCEPPSAITIAAGREIVRKAHATGLVVQIGHQRRYHPNYNLAVRQCREEKLVGRLTRIAARQHFNHSGRRVVDPDYEFNEQERRFITTDLDHHLNWRLYEESSGAPFHDGLPRAIDTANWFCGACPTRAYATGGIDFWRGGRSTPDNLEVIFDYPIRSQRDAFVVIDARDRYQDINQLNRSYTLRCTYSFGMMHAGDSGGERITGDRSTLELKPIKGSRLLFDATGNSRARQRAHRMRLLEKHNEMLGAMTDEERHQFHVTHGGTYDPPGWHDKPPTDRPISAMGSEETSEVHQFRAFADDIRHGGTPRANALVGLAAVIAATSAQKSYETGLPVNIDPALMAFDFDTPSLSGYDPNVAAFEPEKEG